MANGLPKTLQQAIIYFSNPDNCFQYMIARRWPNGVICPTCGRTDVSFLANQKRWQCKTKHSRRQFSIKTGTIFEDSPLGLDTWLTAVWMITNCKNGVSSYEIHRALGITQKSAWFVLHRVRLAMQNGSLNKLDGHIEIDETFVGAKARNMHKKVLAQRVEQFKTPITGATGRNQNIGKVAVMGVLERHGEVRTMVIANTKRETLDANIQQHVATGSQVYTDKLRSYNHLSGDFVHNVIDHAVRYVDGQIHTNGVENYWSLLKRMLRGTYVSVEPFHLFRYLDEQSFRYNNRKGNDSERFERVTGQVSGKRLMYKDLIGDSKEGHRQEN